MKILLLAFSFFTNLGFAQEVNFPSGTTEECKVFVKKLSANYKFGWITTPEDYDRPQEKKINIFWYSKAKPNQLPVIFFNGGPIGTDRSSYSIQSPMEDRFDLGIVYMDQRGTGCSSIPPAIVDEKTAYQSSLYASEGIARDADVLRIKLLGKKTKWTVFGQSYGGMIAARYLKLYPNSILSIHTVSGVPKKDFSDFFYNRMKSYLRQLRYFQTMYPDGLTKMQNFKNRFNSSHCIKAYSTNLCGTDIYYYMMDDLLFTPSTWVKLYEFISQDAGCPECVFKSDGSLSPEYVEAFKKDNDGGFKFFFSIPFQLRVTAAWKQDAKINSSDGSFLNDCLDAYKRLESEGIHVKDMLADHCRLNVAAENDEYFDSLSKTVALTPVKKTLSWKDTVSTLKKHPHLKFYTYTAEFDGGASEGNAPKKMAEALPNQIFYTHFLDGDHWSYMDHSLVWQNMSGLKDRSIENSSVKVTSTTTNVVFNSQATTKSIELMKAQIIEGETLYIGLADKPLDEATQANLKGKIALIRRGKVPFSEKVQRALDAGATAVVLGNNNNFLGRPITPSGVNESVPIPVLMISTLDFDDLLKRNDLRLKLSAAE
ncbi:MAG: alpha/beta fold hydrolase [Bdellovibrionales bacterium]|nr:alpha/beta fold hydrolase [Bdellovibrionales bacterium]